jgi:hypothetical protein
MWNFLQRNSWALPVVFALLLAGVGFTSYRSLQASAKQELADRLTTTRDISINAIEIWARTKRQQVTVHAGDARVVQYTRELLEVARLADDPRRAMLEAPAQALLRQRMALAAETYGFAGWATAGPTGMFLGAGRDITVGGYAEGLNRFLARLLAGETIVTRPMRPELGSPANPGEPRMMAASPLLDENGEPFAVLGLAISPATEFAKLLTAAPMGASGETYAFDHRGRLLSPSRFEEQLRTLGLIGADEGSEMRIQIRDPGVNMAEGHVPELPLEARPFTLAAAEAIAQRDGVNVEGYTDYRGIPVVGAWAWLPDLEIGITSEIDLQEAYGPLFELRRSFGVVLALLAFAALGLFLYSFLAVRLRQQVDEVRQLGRYRIESRLGKGGMGTVYLARHALLRRPTAIKVLNADRSGEEGLARFEREVQTTSSLRHPNTIEIFDYGYSADGTFYYAMEYLQGITIAECVEHDGPQPEARVLHVMRQACGSIAEAHAQGLIHRDIKPANVMLCDRGGMLDFVKVLDFGLVRSERQAEDSALTDVASLTGTPLFMPPEAVRSPESVDARSDVYQLGQLAYFLLTGRHLFSADAPMDVMLKHVSEAPTPPSEALGRAVSPDLEQLILRCLEKAPADRPADAGALLEALEHCKIAGQWAQPEARAWWAVWTEEVGMHDPDAASSAGSAPTAIELARRARTLT